MPDEKALKSIVNGSGFAFQLALAYHVHNSKDKHGWEVSSYEHPWRDPETGSEGFVDLILELGRIRLIVECKRLGGDVSWVFLNPEAGYDKGTRGKFLWSSIQEVSLGFRNISDWSDFSIKEDSPESKFCIVPGQGKSDNPLLERISGQLTTAAECIANEEMEILKKQKYLDTRIYIPAIVTTAKLQLCRFDPIKISLSDGLLSDGTFSSVPFIRFRKSLTTKLAPRVPINDLKHSLEYRERTVLIINAEFFCDILSKIEIGKQDQFEEWPWDLLFRFPHLIPS